MALLKNIKPFLFFLLLVLSVLEMQLIIMQHLHHQGQKNFRLVKILFLHEVVIPKKFYKANEIYVLLLEVEVVHINGGVMLPSIQSGLRLMLVVFKELNEVEELKSLEVEPRLYREPRTLHPKGVMVLERGELLGVVELFEVERGEPLGVVEVEVELFEVEVEVELFEVEVGVEV